MKKLLFVLFLGLVSWTAIVKADEIKLTSTATSEIELLFAVSAVTDISIDWGNGTPEQYNVTVTDINAALQSVKGTPSGTGEITITGAGITAFDCSYVNITQLDVTSAVNLIKLSFNNNNIAAVDLSKNLALYSLHAENNASLTTLDVSKNTALELLYCGDNNMESLDVTENVLLTTLNVNNNKLVSIDLSKNTALKSLYALGNQIENADVSHNTALTYISFNNNKLSSIDVTGLTALKSLFLLNNQLTSITGAENVAATGTVNCTGNKLTIATLPQPQALRTQFNYAPQQALVIAESITTGEELDLSAQTNVKGVTTESQATVYSWATESGVALEKGVDYTEADGKFVFKNAMSEKVVCSMTTAAFPKFTAANVFKTTSIEVNEPNVIKLTSTATSEIELLFAVSAVTDISIDWGNSTPVQYNITVTDINAALQSVKGTLSGTGEITITGAGITAFDCSYASITQLDITSAVNLIKLSFNNNNISSVDLSKNLALYSLHAENNATLTTLDVSNNTGLNLLYCSDNNMESLDVTKNVLLTTLNMNNNKLTAIDLSKNTALKSLYALGNQIENADVSNNTALTYISFNNNKLSSIDVTGLTALKSLFLMNNQLTSITGAENVAATGTVNCTGNKLTIATLPQPQALRTQFNYAPQQPLVISESIITGEELDLSAQTNVKGVTAENQATVYSWETESGTALEKGVDYSETDGKFIFLKPASEKVVCSMTTAAFPKFTAANVFKTTSIEVSYPSGIEDGTSNNINIYSSDSGLVIDNLQGNESIAITTISGIQIYSAIADESKAVIALTSGVYVVLVNGKAYKSIVK